MSTAIWRGGFQRNLPPSASQNCPKSVSRNTHRHCAGMRVHHQGANAMNQSSVIQIASATDNTAPLRAGPFGPEARLSLQLAGRRIIICANIPEGALAIYQ